MTEREFFDALQSRRLPHAALITGASPQGRLSAAKVAARAAVCSGPRPLCGACRDCKKALKDIHPDISFAARDPDGKDLTVDRVRELRAAAFVTPNEARRSVTVITDADAMNEAAQNALLKVLEEPPEHAVFLLLSENPERLLPTVRSRCALYRLDPEEPEDPEEAGEAAGAIWRAYQKENARALLEAVLPLEKATRDHLTDVLWCLRRQAAGGCGALSADRFVRLTDALDRADQYLSVNVSAGHIAGLLLAELL